jgi:hypothetical protein
VAKAGAKPATTIIKSGGATARVATAKPVTASTASTAAAAPHYEEEGSTMLTTVLAGALALLTWGTAGVLIASYLALI